MTAPGAEASPSRSAGEQKSRNDPLSSTMARDQAWCRRGDLNLEHASLGDQPGGRHLKRLGTTQRPPVDHPQRACHALRERLHHRAD